MLDDLELYRRMLVIRRTEEKLLQLHSQGLLSGTTHTSIGQESIAVGLRKPDPRIYQLACRELDVEPAEAVFLDDIGSNLKTARALGMTTIKVDEPGAALAELERVVELSLR